jgi:hypothetical protein
LDITNGELSFVTGQEAIGQHITMRLRTWLGETVYDTRAGVPWLQVIFKGKNPNLDSINFILTQHVQRTPGVISAELELVLDQTTRTLNVTGTAQTIEGDVDFSEIIEATP